eukprot:gene13388-9214_t
MYGVGISLGHSSCYVAVTALPASATWEGESPLRTSIKVVANSAGHRNTPPVCAFTDSSEILFGETAYHNYAREPGNVIPSIFLHAANEHILNASAEQPTVDNQFSTALRRSTSIRYKGHKAVEDLDGNSGFLHEYTQNGNDLSRILSAMTLFVHFLNHVKEHSVNGPCSLNSAEKAEKNVFLTIVVPRYAFPHSEEQNNVRWVMDAVQASDFAAVAAHTNIIFSDEAALMGLDALGPSSPSYKPFLQVQQPRLENVLVVDWGAQGLNMTLLSIADGTIVSNGSHRPYYSSCLAYAPHGGDVIDIALADRVAAAFILQQRKVFQSRIPQFMSAMQPRRDTLGKPNLIVAEHLPARAMRQLRMKVEEKKSSLLSNQQIQTVAVEVEAFYDGMDLLDNQTLNRRKVEMALCGEWGLTELFQRELEQFMRHVEAQTATSPISRVVLSGGMCQIPYFTSALEKIIKHCAANKSGIDKGVDVVEVWKLAGSASADEIFCVGGCLQSCVSGSLFTLKKQIKNVKKSDKTGHEHSKARNDALSLCCELLNGGSRLIDFMSFNVYLYALRDTSSLVEAENGLLGINLQSDSLFLLFSKMSAIPCRRVLRFPPNADAVELYLLTEGVHQAVSDIPQASLYPLTEGVKVTKPLIKGHGNAFIVITCLMEQGTLVIRVQSITSKTAEVPQFIRPRSIKFSKDVSFTS